MNSFQKVKQERDGHRRDADAFAAELDQLRRDHAAVMAVLAEYARDDDGHPITDPDALRKAFEAGAQEYGEALSGTTRVDGADDASREEPSGSSPARAAAPDVSLAIARWLAKNSTVDPVEAEALLSEVAELRDDGNLYVEGEPLTRDHLPDELRPAPTAPGSGGRPARPRFDSAPPKDDGIHVSPTTGKRFKQDRSGGWYEVK